MSQKESGAGKNRRDVLKKIGAAGAIGTVGFPTGVVAGSTPSDEYVSTVLDEPQVKQIRDVVGSLSVEEAVRKERDVDGTKISVTELQTDLGTLTNTEIGNGVEAKLELDISGNPQLSQSLPTEIASESAESTPFLVSDGSSVTIARMATDDELTQLEDTIEDNVISAVYTDDVNGFKVATGTVSKDTADVQQYQVRPHGEPLSAASVEPVVSAQNCTYTCISCAGAVVAKGFCYSTCAAALSGVGLASCIACVVTSNISLGSCGLCIDCFY